MSGKGSRLEQVDDDAAVQTELGMVLVVDDFLFEIVVSFYLEKVVIYACIDIKWDIVGIVLVSSGIPVEAIVEDLDDGGVGGYRVQQSVVRSVKRHVG